MFGLVGLFGKQEPKEQNTNDLPTAAEGQMPGADTPPQMPEYAKVEAQQPTGAPSVDAQAAADLVAVREARADQENAGTEARMSALKNAVGTEDAAQQVKDSYAQKVDTFASGLKSNVQTGEPSDPAAAAREIEDAGSEVKILSETPAAPAVENAELSTTGGKMSVGVTVPNSAANAIEENVGPVVHAAESDAVQESESAAPTESDPQKSAA